jgi:hypothetical protein
MSKTGEHGKTPPPPLDEDGNPIAGDDASIADTSMNPMVEELMKKLEKLNVKLTKLKVKDKKAKKLSSLVNLTFLPLDILTFLVLRLEFG